VFAFSLLSFFPSGLVSCLGSVRKMNLCSLNGLFFACLTQSFPNLTEFSPAEEKIRESFKDLKEFHEFFILCFNL
jgi:hypothetical protein